ncbi:MAG: urate hydroxylase PuuD [Alphaproteobacteria bacterium]|nr:urate hydroxylase PuuD [Alphaproteobacteria bacterium]
MSSILSDLKKTVIAGFIVTLLLFAMYYLYGDYDGMAFGKFLFRWLHVICGVMWIGILWYFNFVQIPNMPKIPDEQKPAISKVIAPAALWWFRWAAMGTIATGLMLATMNGYIVEVLSLGLMEDGTAGHRMLGIGMWFGIVMWFNVWFIIWPNQKIALGIVDAEAEEKAAAARTAMLFSRTNTLLSFPMLFAMIAAQGLYNVS